MPHPILHVDKIVLLSEFGFQLHSDRREQFLVMRHEGTIEIAVPEYDRIAPGLEPDPTTEMGLQELAMLFRADQFDPQRDGLSLGAALGRYP